MVLPTFLGQLLFFGMCDVALTEYDLKKNILEELNTLLFYYIITYFIQRILDIIQKVKNRRADYRLNSFFICILKLLLEWAKAVIVIVCLKEQGLKLNTTPRYVALTINYYLSTEPTYVKLFPVILKALHLHWFDGMESFYAPVILEGSTICMTVVLVACVARANIYFALICLYFAISKMMSTWNGSWKALRQEKGLLEPFRKATRHELAAWNDICAVCLCGIGSGRITACEHIFHGDCLRRCIKTSNKCPLCKEQLSQNPEFIPDPAFENFDGYGADIQNLEINPSVDLYGDDTTFALRNMVNPQMSPHILTDIYNRQASLRDMIHATPPVSLTDVQDPRRQSRRNNNPGNRRTNNRAGDVERYQLYPYTQRIPQPPFYTSRERSSLRRQPPEVSRRNYNDAQRLIASAGPPTIEDEERP